MSEQPQDLTNVRFPSPEAVARQHRWSIIKHSCRCGDVATFDEWPMHFSDEWDAACTVSTVEQLDALPEETVINDSHGCTAKKLGGEWWWIATADSWVPNLPALILSNPDWSVHNTCFEPPDTRPGITP